MRWSLSGSGAPLHHERLHGFHLMHWLHEQHPLHWMDGYPLMTAVVLTAVIALLAVALAMLIDTGISMQTFNP